MLLWELLSWAEALTAALLIWLMMGMTHEATVQEFTHNFILFEFENAGLQKCYEFTFVEER